MAESGRVENVSRCIRFIEKEITIDLNIFYYSNFLKVSVSGLGDKDKILSKIINHAVSRGLEELLIPNIEEEINLDNVSTT